jgi:hypothetical protein
MASGKIGYKSRYDVGIENFFMDHEKLFYHEKDQGGLSKQLEWAE